MLKRVHGYVFAPPPQPSAAVLDDFRRFPVRRIFCVGRNYADHAREMGSDPRSEPPVFFTKPGDALVESGAEIPYAAATSNLHYEAELVVAIGAPGVAIAAEAAAEHIWGYAVGCDLTRRDWQGEAKQAGAPWDAAKAFDRSAPLGPITPAGAIPTPRAARLWLSVNGVVRQDANTADMIWSVEQIIAQLSSLWALAAGDLIFTGTPAGVGPLQRGDTVELGVDGLAPLRFSIGSA